MTMIPGFAISLTPLTLGQLPTPTQTQGDPLTDFRREADRLQTQNPGNTPDPVDEFARDVQRFRDELNNRPVPLGRNGFSAGSAAGDRLARDLGLVRNPNPNGPGLIDSRNAQGRGNRGRYFINQEDGSIFYEAYTLQPGETARHATETRSQLYIPNERGGYRIQQLPLGTTTPPSLIAISRMNLCRGNNGRYTSPDSNTEHSITPDGRLYNGSQISPDGVTWTDCPDPPPGLAAIERLNLRRGINGYTASGVQGTFEVNQTNGIVQYRGTGTPPGSSIRGDQFYDSSNPDRPRFIRGLATNYSYSSGPANDGSGTWIYTGTGSPESRNDSMYILSNGRALMLHNDPNNPAIYINNNGTWERLAQGRTMPPVSTDIQNHRHYQNNEINEAITQILTSRTNRNVFPTRP